MQQGWTLQRTAYCQLIQDANKVKRLEYAPRMMESGDTFHNIIFSDECSISLQQYRCTCYSFFLSVPEHRRQNEDVGAMQNKHREKMSEFKKRQ